MVEVIPNTYIIDNVVIRRLFQSIKSVGYNYSTVLTAFQFLIPQNV